MGINVITLKSASLLKTKKKFLKRIEKIFEMFSQLEKIIAVRFISNFGFKQFISISITFINNIFWIINTRISCLIYQSI